MKVTRLRINDPMIHDACPHDCDVYKAKVVSPALNAAITRTTIGSELDCEIYTSLRVYYEGSCSTSNHKCYYSKANDWPS